MFFFYEKAIFLSVFFLYLYQNSNSRVVVLGDSIEGEIIN